METEEIYQSNQRPNEAPDDSNWKSRQLFPVSKNPHNTDAHEIYTHRSTKFDTITKQNSDIYQEHREISPFAQTLQLRSHSHAT